MIEAGGFTQLATLATLPFTSAPHGSPLDAGTGPRVADAAAREAILKSLYEARTPLTRARRLGTLSSEDSEYLAEIEAYIDQLEAAETRSPTQESEVMRKLQEIAASMMAAQAAVERNGR